MAEDPAGLTPEERKYFMSRGESDIPAPPAPPSDPLAEPAPSAEASSSAAPSPVQAADKEPPVQDLKADRQKTVPHEALEEERKRRKDAEERVRQAELMQARMEERFKAYVDVRTPPPAAPKPPPRPDQDIFGAVDHLMKEVDRRGKEIDGYKEGMVRDQRQRQMDEWARAHEAEFVKSNPDYIAALNYMRTGRALELQALGMTNRLEIENQLNAEERALAQRAANQQKSPAEMAYNLAKARGYQKSNNAPPRMSAPAPDPNRQLDVIESGQRQSGSMENVGGAAPPTGEITLADLVKMPDSEFFAYKAKNPAKYRRLKGAEH